MRRISWIALLGMMVFALAVGGSALAMANGHSRGHGHVHAKLADVVKDVKDANKDSTDAARDRAAAQNDTTNPDSAAEAQQEQLDAHNEQADNQSETRDGQQEGENPAQAIACRGLLTDNVQYDDQTGTCTAESGQDNGSTGDAQDTGSNLSAGQDNNHNR